MFKKGLLTILMFGLLVSHRPVQALKIKCSHVLVVSLLVYVSYKLRAYNSNRNPVADRGVKKELEESIIARRMRPLSTF